MRVPTAQSADLDFASSHSPEAIILRSETQCGLNRGLVRTPTIWATGARRLDRAVSEASVSITSLAEVIKAPLASLLRRSRDATRRLLTQLINVTARRHFVTWCRINLGGDPEWKQGIGRRPIALFEVNTLASAHIAYAFLADSLVAKHGCEIVGYSLRPAKFRRPSRLCRPPWPNDIYRAFGARRTLRPVVTSGTKRQAHEWAEQTAASFTSKSDLATLEVAGVQIGDLIYDDYLNSTKQPTVDFNDPAFVRFLGESVALFWAWEAIFEEHAVVAVNVSHCVYLLAIPLRIAISRGIDAFQVNATHAYRLSHSQKFAYTGFLDYATEFGHLSNEAQLAARLQAEERLALRLGGSVGVDMSYSRKSAYTAPVSSQRALSQTRLKKVLIATHCFFDSPHPYGATLFPDFYEWLTFIGELSIELDYEFYLKVHPDFQAGSKTVVDSFVKRYPGFHALPPDISHHQLISEGITAALTVHGTIGHEYAWLGLPVINASLNNPHIAFGFNIHPSTINEFERALRDLKNTVVSPDRKDIAAFYYMHYLRRSENLIFGNYEEMLEQMGGYAAQFGPSVYSYWLRKDSSRASRLQGAFRDFVLANDYRLEMETA